MTRFILFLLISANFLFVDQIFAQESIRTKGSDTMLPLIKALTNNYDQFSHETFEVLGGGSSLGFKGLRNFNIALALSSRKVRSTEQESIEDNEDQLIEKVIAFDALSIIVHPSNRIKQLTIPQLQKIFKGQITNWSQLGGEDLPILVISRDKNSGSYSFMKNEIVRGNTNSNNIKEVHSNASVVENVSRLKGAIGYCGIAYIEEVVQPISIAKTEQRNYVYPSFKNALNKQYPLSRPLYFYYRISDKLKLSSFVNFTMSDKGQQIIAHKGYIPVL
ncbi:PstS family phosphate ABC transporter substrate-binding protein [Flammeovirga pacifica]|uniref:Phosphate-binding protein n=1 Tax=Flammeovirga pacifica TaxID=915059 RepID=A0A1S1YVJ0_FLAPC|nr:PstS family phosphate ABC transporter substrate-binding protein [Flammeovirga pacifica]OHX65039.1 hypothetical protein NH26_01070 [Flammeovirga pacifica]